MLHIPLLEHVAIRSLELRKGSATVIRTIRGIKTAAGASVGGVLMLEVGPVPERTVSHALFGECAGAIETDAGWAAWTRRLERDCGTAVTDSMTAGADDMIARAATVGFTNVARAALPPCAECDSGYVQASGRSSTWRSGITTGTHSPRGGGARGMSRAQLATGAVMGPIKAGRSAGQLGGGTEAPIAEPESPEMPGLVSESESGSCSSCSDGETEAAGPSAVEAAAGAHDVWLRHDAAAEEAADLMDEVSSDTSAAEFPLRRAGARDSKMVAMAAMALVTAIVMAPKTGTGPYPLFVATLTAALTSACDTVPSAVHAFQAAMRPVGGHVRDSRRISRLWPYVSAKSYGHLQHLTQQGVSLHYDGPRERRETPPLASARDRGGGPAGFWAKTWELLRLARVLSFTRVAARQLPIISIPIGAVAKHDSNGAETCKWRFFHHLSKCADGINVNAISSRERHGPISLPHHRQVIHRCLAYRILVGPLIDLLLSKQDADGAFQNLEVKAEGVPVIATDFACADGDFSDGGGAHATGVDVETLVGPDTDPGVATLLREAGAAAEVMAQCSKAAARWGRSKNAALRTAAAAGSSLLTICYLTGTFGHCGMSGAGPIESYHDSFTAAVPEVNGTWPFSTYVFVDGAVDVCPDVGVRRWLSEYTLLSGMFLASGPGAYNAAKTNSVDGAYQTRKVIWGIGYDTAAGVLFITPERVERARGKLWSREFDWGTKDVTIKQLQSLYGVIRNIGEVYPPLREHYKAVSNMMATADPERLKIVPRGTEEQQLRSWTRF